MSFYLTTAYEMAKCEQTGDLGFASIKEGRSLIAHDLIFGHLLDQFWDLEIPSMWQGSVIDLESAFANQGTICDRPRWYGTPMGTWIRLSLSARGWSGGTGPSF